MSDQTDNQQTETDISVRSKFTQYVYDLQDSICKSLEELEPVTRFHEDNWKREEGGGGRTRVIEHGEVFEKGGVNCSTVYGELPEAIRQRFGVAKGRFYATGISLVIHPANPMVPTVHANYRFFELYGKDGKTPIDAWFGGGADLTPYYLWEEDACHFHSVLKEACDRHDPRFYPRFKKECDSYFNNTHRSNERRGIGGIFFDYCRPDEEHSLKDWCAFAMDAGDVFVDSYLPIVKRRMALPFDEHQRYFQEIRRGRYAEFNLIHDRGTLFGLKTNGRIDSILMSLPPRVRWDYHYTPVAGSREEDLLEVLRHPKDWV